jgi:hypothetical protein
LRPRRQKKKERARQWKKKSQSYQENQKNEEFLKVPHGFLPLQENKYCLQKSNLEAVSEDYSQFEIKVYDKCESIKAIIGRIKKQEQIFLGRF